jgi:predicted ester cyclase
MIPKKRAPLLVIVLTVSLCGFSQNVNKNLIKSQTRKMDTIQLTQNKDVVLDLYENVLNKKKLELLGEYIADDFVGTNGKKGSEGFQQPLLPLIQAFPDFEYKLEELICEGDKVAVQWKLSGTHTGQFQYIAPTGKTFSNTGMAIFQLRNSRITKAQVLTDRLGFLQELDVLPLDLSSLVYKTRKENVNFIDKFFVPATAQKEFLERMSYNQRFIKTLPGFIRHEAFEKTDEKGNMTMITIAVWENMDSVSKAKEAVEAEYKRIGFNLPDFLQRLNITIERGLYEAIGE